MPTPPLGPLGPRRPLLVLGLSLLCACNRKPSTAALQEQASPPGSAAASVSASKGNDHVAIKLRALDSDQDGRWDQLAIEWRIKRGWHIYWTNPGDSGMPTKVHMQGPSQALFKPARLPAPERWSSPGGIVGYGYSDQTAFFSGLLDPSKAPSQVDLKLSWLVCKDSCLRGTKTLQWTPPPKADPWSEQSKRAWARLPKTSTALRAKHHWRSRQPSGSTLEIRALKGTFVEFFPLENDGGLESAEREGSTLRLHYRSAQELQGGNEPQGLVGLRVSSAVEYYPVQFPWP